MKRGGGGGGKALVSLAITPTPAPVHTGATAQLTCIGTYSDSTTANLTSAVTWGTANAGLATVSSGSAGGVLSGVARTTGVTITATLGAVSTTVSAVVTIVPTATLLAPNAGGSGTPVVITGTGFYTVTAVAFNGTPAASFTVDSPTQITAVAPVGVANGAVTVTAEGGIATGPAFTVNPLTMDFTAGILPARLTVARTGGTHYLQQASTSVVASSTAAALFEDRADGGGKGLWIFDAYANDAPPFDFSLAAGWGYISNDSLHQIADDTTGPDGTLTADRLTDSDVTYYSHLRITGASASTTTPNVGSIWVKDYAPNPPTIPGVITNGGLEALSFCGSLGSGSSAWRRAVCVFYKSALGKAFLNIYFAGVTPVGNGSTTNNAAVGAINVWGAQTTQAEGDVPLVNGSTSAVVAQVNGSMATMVQGASDMHVIAKYLFDPQFPNAYVNDSPWIFSYTTADGESGVFINSQVTFNGQVNGVGAGVTNPSTWNYLTTVECAVEQFSISTKGAGTQIWVNGCRFGGQTSNRGTFTAMHTPSAFYLGSHAGAAGSFMPRRFTSLDLISTLDPDRAEGVILSDSIMSPYLGKPAVGPFIYTLAESRARTGIVSHAVPGYKFSDSLAIWQNTLYCQQRGRSDVRWVIIQLGLNDALANRTEAQMVADLNTMIADINTNNPTAKILISPPTPASGGAGGLTGSIATGQTKEAYNFALDIAGTGPLAGSIVGSNLIRMAYHDWLDAGFVASGTRNFVINPAYDSGDGIHDSPAGRAYQGGTEFRAKLQANGLL